MNKLFKDALILAAITIVAGCLLGLVNEITKGPIEQANIATTNAAYRAVFEDASDFVQLDGFDAVKATETVNNAGYTDDDIDQCVLANDSTGNTLGYVITTTTHAGYGGAITLSVGITNDGVVNGYSITDIAESPGLGMNAKEEKFYGQFEDISEFPLSVVKTTAASSSEIEAISGATITSKAVTNAVNAAYTYYQSIGGGSNE